MTTEDPTKKKLISESSISSWMSRKVAYGPQADEYLAEIQKKLNFDQILKLKKLKMSLDMISSKIFKNHVHMGMLKHTFKKSSGKEGESNKLDSSTFDFLGMGNDWKESFFIVVCSKAFSVYGEAPDEEMISEVDLPHWMELNTLYEFRYENDKDESEAIEKIHGNKIQVIEPVFDKSMKGNHQFVVETKDRTTYYGADYCKQVNKWVVALRKAKMTSEEISRTKANGLTKNIDPWIAMYRKGVDNLLKPANAASSREVHQGTRFLHKSHLDKGI